MQYIAQGYSTEYLWRDSRIQNLVKNLRWSALEFFKLFLQKTPSSIFERVLNMCLVLSEFWIFINFCKYDRVLNMHQDAIMETLWVNISGFQECQVSAYTSIGQSSEYVSIWLNNSLWQGSEYAWSTFHRVLNKPPVLDMPELRIW